MATTENTAPETGGDWTERERELNARFQAKFAEIKAEKEQALSELKKAQSGSDRKVMELQAENEAIKAELQKATTTDKTGELEYKNSLILAAATNGKDPNEYLELAESAKDPGAFVEKLTERDQNIYYQAMDKYTRTHGRRVYDAKYEATPSYSDIHNMTKEEAARLSPNVVDRALKEEMKKAKPSIWQKALRRGNK